MMKLKKYIYGVALGVFSLTFASCYNADREFPDYEGGTTAYFAYQYPIRTLVLGNDIYNNDLDNAHKCQIWATMGGAYGGRNATVDIVVDESLCDNLWFPDEGGNPHTQVLPLPHDFYNYDELATSVINYNGEPRGYVEVKFTDKFFSSDNSDKTTKTTYVIPLRMTNVSGIDRILTGTPLEGTNPVRTNTEEWSVLAKDYVLYCVKYMNPWEGKYIRRGVDKIQNGALYSEVVRKDMSLVNTDLEHYKENPVNANDEVCSIKTKNMTQAIFPVSFRVAGGSIYCNLILTFNGDQCTVSTDDENVTASGSGEFITKGTERPEYKEYQWGSNEGVLVQRDILRLAYEVKFNDKDIQISTADTLVVQTRDANKREFFEPKYVK